MKEAGLLSYWKKQEYHRHSVQQLNENNLNTLHSFSLKQLQSLFYVLIVSVIVCIICFICEFMHLFVKFESNYLITNHRLNHR